MLKVRELTDATGALTEVFLRCTEGVLELVIEKDVVALPEKALEAVMRRYGAPFDPDAPIAVVGTLPLGPGKTLRHVRHLAGYDVIARDYLVYEGADVEALCALSTTVARGLEHLASVRRPHQG